MKLTSELSKCTYHSTWKREGFGGFSSRVVKTYPDGRKHTVYCVFDFPSNHLAQRDSVDACQRLFNQHELDEVAGLNKVG